ncbi:MAG: FAD-binding oxidoreductase [archaeon]|nr:FAD-binding oxidoreductase [archaeon]
MDLKKLNLMYKENRVTIKNKDDIFQKLLNILGKDKVSMDQIDIFAYSQDRSLISLNWRIEKKIAALAHFITWPQTAEHISEIFKLANQEKIPVIPYAEGSGCVGGSLPVHGGIIVDMKHFKKVIELNKKNLTITVETGMNGMNLERFLENKGFTAGHIPQSLYTSSVGGYIAHRAAGQFSTKYGKIEDIVLGMEVVLPTGEIVNFKTIPRASTGPQLEKIFIGNEGTLGIVTKAVLRIWPVPEKRALLSYAFNSYEDALETAREIVQQQIFPAVIRLYDDYETYNVFPDVTEAKDKFLCIFVCEGSESLVKLEEEITKKCCEKHSGVSCGEEPVEHWFKERFVTANYFPLYNWVVDTIEVSIMWDKAIDVYNAVLDASMKINGMIVVSAHVSHFYANGVGTYFTFSGVATEGKSHLDFYQEGWDTILKAVLDNGGILGHHHGVGINRANMMQEEWGETGFKLLKDVKNLLDPNNIMNPGKVYSILKSWKKNRGGK